MTDTRLAVWSADSVPRDVARALQRLVDTEDVVRVAAMPDVHLARDVCVGCVVATRDHLFPEAVGGDIGCGMAALRFDGDAELLGARSAAGRVLRFLNDHIPTAQHPSASARLPAELADSELSAPALEKKKASIGRVQFATLGRGNHFVEFQRESSGQLWLMIHSGSRGMGQAIRDHHARHGRVTGTSLGYVSATSAEGRAYLSDLSWALHYAQRSRRRMAEIIANGMSALFGVQADLDSCIDCHHNFVRYEQHQGTSLWVHRKGAISAAADEPGIIPGSMGSASFHVTGRGNLESLCSSSHGAGRVMSRTEARRAVTTRALMRQMEGIWFDHRLADRLRDEAPGAYKDIGAVMRAQRDLTRVIRRLEPVLVYKGG